MGRNLSQPLKFQCRNFEDIRRFLSTCRYAREDLENKGHYWQPPEEFELTRSGLCVDFAIWTWRQLLDMGYRLRLSGGKAGKFGEGHAWVTFQMGGRWYLLEPQRWYLGPRLPRVLTLTYHPTTSVGWNGKQIEYYAHERRRIEPPLQAVPGMVAEYLDIYGRFWITQTPKIVRALAGRILRLNGKSTAPRPAA
jgi:Transglutaminase-like domain